ncbi:hypothetical protein BN946_scf184794.g18 [Trametes cinnabarina]|uniref:FAD/NAD(P)-binding domain-containing protein n=1 Tax=Pycnoporus cinnabarinus TaxID=5643 RepID=A0A060SLZ9_PYCCI|nr:hypothetical protein BN946_scf184794.g18 [Trametes cinnabarina]
MERNPREESIAVIGSGVAGLITAYTLIRDGFTEVDILTRDAQVGGIWAKDRIYPGLFLNNVHGEYRLSPLKMPPPVSGGDRLGGDDMNQYFEAFASKFLSGKIQFNLDVHNIRRPASGEGWLLDVTNLVTGVQETREYARLVLCTGGSSNPRIPQALSPETAAAAGFKGLVFHTVDFARKLDELLAHAAAAESGPETPSVVVIGGGKSAQDVCAYLANEGKKVTLVCHNLDPFTAGPKPLPDFIRRSRLLSLFSPHIHLRTALERFLHTTWLGKKIVDFTWHGLAESSFKAMNIPEGSPLRNTVSAFWHVRVSDEGVPRPNGFHPLAVAGKIEVLSPAHATGFSEDGTSIVLDDGRTLPASVLVLATGYTSSWPSLFEETTINELGLRPHLAQPNPEYQWDYTTLSDAPPLHPDAEKWSSSLYRGLVPAQNIARRDFAVNGACISPNNGYTLEVASHWISSHFLRDKMRIPQTPEDALKETERAAAWLKRRYPEVPTALNASLTGYLAFWSWPQHADDLLEDMRLPVMRGGGNGLTWPFQVVDLKEIEHLKEERDAKRSKSQI